MSPDPIKLNPDEASDLRRWLSLDDSRSTPLSNGYQGAVYLYESPFGPRIIKEALGSGLQYRVGRAMLNREFEAYRRLQGVAGVPRCFGLLDDRFLVLEFVKGEGLRHVHFDERQRDAFFAALLDTIKAVHHAGIAHNDLKRKDNILVTPAGEPVLLDFGLAYFNPGAKESMLFRLLKRMDYNSWIKIKYNTDVDSLSEADRPYYNPTLVEIVFRQLRRFWRTITLRQWRRARQAGNDEQGA